MAVNVDRRIGGLQCGFIMVGALEIILEIGSSVSLRMVEIQTHAFHMEVLATRLACDRG